MENLKIELDKYHDNMTVRDVMKVLNCSRGHVINLIDHGRIRGFRIADFENSSWRIEKSSLLQYLTEINS